MPLPSFRNSRSKVRRRRSHHALKPSAVNVCSNCAAPVLPHTVCKSCGFYKGRAVRASLAQVEKILDKKTAELPAEEKKVAPRKRTAAAKAEKSEKKPTAAPKKRSAGTIARKQGSK
jgi:large subunit ribosomal protein L32